MVLGINKAGIKEHPKPRSFLGTRFLHALPHHGSNKGRQCGTLPEEGTTNDNVKSLIQEQGLLKTIWNDGRFCNQLVDEGFARHF